MKKSLLFLALVLLLLLFVSCSKDGEDNKTIENDTQRQTESENEMPQPEFEVMDDISEDKNSEKEAASVVTEVFTDIVSVNKGIMETYEWAEGDAAMKARNKTTYIVLNEKEREKYPSLAQKLDEIADLCIKSADTDLENLIYLADQQLEMYDGFNTQTSTLDMHIRRSDSTVFSMLSDSYMDTTYIEDLRAIHGSNYDTKSGKELAITDVIKDIPKFAEIVEDELFSHMWGGELLCDTAVKDYFDNRTPEGVSWSLDYNGVTIYFNRGDIAEPVFGLVPVTVSFEEYPELFWEKYTKAPEAYIMKLPLNCSSFLDINNDGKLEEFVVSAHYDEEYRFYSDIYLITSTDFYEENFFSYGFNPYYIKTSDDRHFLYVFGEGAEDFHRLMRLYMYEITGGKIERLGEMAVAPHHDVDDCSRDMFALPTNPECMLFDVYHEEEGFFYPRYSTEYRVDEDGFPTNLVYVDSVEELLGAVSPGASICINKGKYNLSEYINTLTKKQIAEMNENNPFVNIRECFDGYEVVIMNATDINIFGETLTADDVEFVTDYRYATVFCFENCNNVSLSGMKLGHTKMAECDGDVLNFSGCSSVSINNADLYGCGVYGIVADLYCSNFYVSATNIHDCENGPVCITEGVGDFTFFDCNLSDSTGFGLYEKTDESFLNFYNCTFGQRETEYFMFHDDVYTENCTWSEDIEYPEYGYEDYCALEEALLYFEPEIMEMVPLDEEDFEDTYWDGYMKVVQESGYTTYFPEFIDGIDEGFNAGIELLSDGRAEIQNRGETLTGKWYGYDNDDYSICVALDEGYYAYISLFAVPDTEGAVEWMMLQLGEELIWMYKN